MGFPRHIFCLLALIGIGIHDLGAQVPRQASTFTDFQKELHGWLSDPDHRAQKGWKTLKRWEDFETRRMNPDGGSGDPREFARIAEAIAAQKGIAASHKTAGGGWTPYGPNDYAQSNIHEWITGIGRINCIAFHPSNPDIFWVGVAQGGIWKTINGGSTWTPIGDNLPILRISDIAVNPVNPDEMYVSMGDMAYFGAGLTLDDRKRHTHYGLGVYKTTDGGQTWQPTGLNYTLTQTDFSLTRRVFIHPTNTNHLVAAGPSGIWKSTDGGTFWNSVDQGVMWDIERSPSNPDVLYASSGYRSSLSVGDAGIWKSTDFGSSWNPLPTGIVPQGVVQRIELAISPVNEHVYALCAGMDAGFAGLYRSTNGGSTWELRSSNPNILGWDDGNGSGGQGWYDLTILAHPTIPDLIYTGGINLWGSTDAGQTWGAVGYWLSTYGPSVHADQHQLAYNPVSGKYYICNDGGLYSTSNIQIGSWLDAQSVPGYQWPTTWTPLSSGMQVTSFYRVGTSDANPGRIIAGAQDNATFYYNGSNWLNVIGGDGMDCFLDPVDPNILYGSSQYGNLNVSVDGGQTFGWVSSIPEGGEWVTPWQLDPSDRNSVYAALGNVWKSTDLGSTWNPVSNFPVNANLGQSNYASAFAISPSQSTHMYVSKRFYQAFGELSEFWSTTDGGVTWNPRTGLPTQLYHTSIAVDSDDPLRVWVTVGGFVSSDKVFESTDGGGTWTNISANLPNIPVNVVVQHAGNALNPLYLGTDLGVYYRNDTMTNWVLYSTDLPNVIVSDLDIHPSSQKIYAATFGRGIWGADLRDATSSEVEASAFRAMQIELFPNPAQGRFELRLTDAPQVRAEVCLIDVMGRELLRQDLPIRDASASLRFDQDLKPGLYFVRIEAAGLSSARKIVISE